MRDKNLNKIFGFIMNTGLVTINDIGETRVLTGNVDERTLDGFEEVLDYWEGQSPVEKYIIKNNLRLTPKFGIIALYRKFGLPYDVCKKHINK